MPVYADRVKDTTTTAGTGAITVAGSAPTTYQTLATALGSSSRINVGYTVVHQSANEWEVGLGTFNGTTGLTRDVVRAGSSGPGVLVNFSAGTKDVFVTIAADEINNANLGMQFAAARGCLPP
jgi:hypothetical protein